MPVAHLVPDEEEEPTEDNLQLLLERAIRESLREVAKSAFEPEHGSASQSIDSLVRDVSHRVLKESGLSLSAGVRSMESVRNPRVELPLLEDLQAMPWVLWREASSPGRGMRSMVARRHSDVFRLDAEHMLSSPSVPSAVDDICLSMVHDDESEPEDVTRLEQAAGLDQGACLTRVSSFEDKAEEAARAEASDNEGRLHPRGNSLRSGFSAELGGPKVVRDGLTITPSSSHLLMHWQNRPRTVLIIAKPRDPIVLATVQDMVAWLASQGIVPILEQQLLSDQPQLRSMLPGARTFSTADRLERRVDLVITVGGDGTLTWAVSLFRRAGMPPVLSFAAGSLGFLTPYSLEGWVRTLTHILDLHNKRAPLAVVCRMRLVVHLHRRVANDHISRRISRVDMSGDGQSSSPTGPPSPDPSEGRIQVETFQCLNEVLVHRGNSGSLAKLDVSVDGDKVTLVQGDGVILATPTGSTAYSLAAGGSMVHPGVPGILLTPVSPHSLSFRPAVLPDSAVITIGVPLTARHGAALSIDGKDIAQLKLGDSIEVSMSAHPVPTICRQTETLDWFASVQDGLQWNGRVEQK